MKIGNAQMLIIIGVIIIIGIILWNLTSKPPPENPSRKDEITYVPPPIQPPIDPYTMLCTLPNGKTSKCNEDTKDSNKLLENEKWPNQDGLSPELKLCNQTPIKLDIYHRPHSSQSFIFVGSIPSMKSMYVYEDSKGNKFYKDDDLFATEHGQTKILYLSVPIVLGQPKVVWGASSSNIDESKVIVNLIGEIDHVKFRNYSLVPYKLYYYGEYLGLLNPYDKENDLYTELYIQRQSQGFRLNSKVTLEMQDVKGPVQSQSIELTNREMTLLNVGLVLMEPLSE